MAAKHLLALVVLAVAVPAQAVIIDGGTGTGNTTPPPAFPYWDAIGQIGGGTGIYLGNGYILTAQHIHDYDNPSTITFAGTSYALNPGSWTELNTDGQAADLTLVRVNGAFPAVPYVPASGIFGYTPPNNALLYMFGYGRNRSPDLTTWYVDQGPTPWVWATTGSGTTFSGYTWAAGNTKRWGTNNVAGTATLEYTITYAGTSQQLSTAMVFTAFNSGVAGGNECQAAVGDSGGPAFRYVGGAWHLAGVNLTISNYSGQPYGAAVYGNLTYMADLSLYASQILPFEQTQSQPGAGLWCSPGTWDNGVPTLDIDAVLGNGGTVTIGSTCAALARTLSLTNATTLNLAGGALTVAGAMTKDAGSTFGFSGGTLTAATVKFDVAQTGGRLWVTGQSTTVNGNYQLTGGSALPTIQVDAGVTLTVTGNLAFSAAGGVRPRLTVGVAGASSYGRAAVGGSVNFGGTNPATSQADLLVTLPAWPSAAFPVDISTSLPYPLAGSAASYDVLTYGGTRTGTFSGVTSASANWSVLGNPLTYDDANKKVTLSSTGFVWDLKKGDTNADHSIDYLDLGNLAGHWNQGGAGINWSSGDFNCDGTVDYLDLGTLAGQWNTGYAGGGMIVPEPATLGLLVLGGLALLWRRRR